MDKLHYKSAVDIAELIRSKKVSAVEVLEHFLKRIETYNPKLNAIIWMDAERGRKRAREADAAIARGENWGPLHGVPMTIKESFEVLDHGAILSLKRQMMTTRYLPLRGLAIRSRNEQFIGSDMIQGFASYRNRECAKNREVEAAAGVEVLLH